MEYLPIVLMISIMPIVTAMLLINESIIEKETQELYKLNGWVE